MKRVLILAIALGLSGSVFAAGTGDYGSVDQGSARQESEPISIEGQDAKNLTSVLVAIGAYEDGAMGTFGTTAEDVSCSAAKNKKSSGSCTLSVQNETGSVTKRVVSGKLAQKLTSILIDAGVVGCGMESCQGGTASITCLHGASEEGTPNWATCAIAQLLNNL